MHENFKKFLVLIDFSAASIHAAEESARIATKFNSDLHLLHVSSNYYLPYLLLPEATRFNIPGKDERVFRKNKFRLEKLKIDLENRFGLNILTHEVSGSLKEKVNSYVSNYQIDLVVIGIKKKSGLKEYVFGSTAEIIINTLDCEVLCVHEESNCSKLKKIVIPLGKFIPKRKINLAYELARKFATKVYLISLAETTNGLSNDDIKVLIGAYQYLKNITNISVECNTVTGINIADAAVRYAKNIGADLILVNPGNESRMPGSVLKRWGGDIVIHSPIPVLSVHPTLDKN